VAEGAGAPDLESAVRHQLYLGDDAFVERMGRKSARASASPEVPRRQRAVKSLAAYARQAADRDAAIAAAWASGAYTQPEIGAHFGLHYSTVSRIARRADARNKT
jgi:hypothetical protein